MVEGQVSTERQPTLAERYARVRARTLALAAPLSAEDQQLQSMPDASPTKWHLAHTTWFFETFVLREQLDGYHAFHERFGYLFNSYYDAVGPRHERAQRGMLSRPSLAEVLGYREYVDEHLALVLRRGEDPGGRIALGLEHEQQHQELLLTDIKHALSLNPLRPAYGPPPSRLGERGPASWLEHGEGLRELGAAAGAGFCFDNERPRHRVFVHRFALASAPATCEEYLAFIADGGYRRPELWLSDGWAAAVAGGWQAPLYWERAGDDWRLFTLGGPRELDPAEPVSHVSYYEADAFARWAGARLPTEAEWEVAAEGQPVAGNLLEQGRLHPAAASGSGLRQLFGDVWEWTASAYLPYPGFQPEPGAVGEYNGKFMVGQQVLRGGSCATPAGHVRATYRNFFPPGARWQFSGIRLARDA